MFSLTFSGRAAAVAGLLAAALAVGPAAGAPRDAVPAIDPTAQILERIDLEEQVRATFESLAEGKFEDCSRATPRLARLAHNPAFGETDVELRQLASRRAILSRPAVVAAIDRTGRRVTTPFAGRYYPE